MRKSETYVVRLVRPAGVSIMQMEDYIRSAVGAWGGQYRHEDPLFYPWVVGKTLTVRRRKVDG